jgi:predicted RND superfamily exporter protein
MHITATVFFVIIIFGIGWQKHLRIDTNWLDSWGEDSSIVQSIQFMEEKLGHSYTLELKVELPPGDEFEDPAVLRKIGDLSQYLSDSLQIGTTSSVIDLISRLNRLLHDDSPSFERFGDTVGANAGLTELIRLDDPASLENWLSLSRSHVRVSVDSPEVPYQEASRRLDEIRSYVAAEIPGSWKIDLSGEYAITVDWVRDVQTTQLRSFPIAFGLVLCLVAFFLRSLPLGLVAMIPAVVPVVVVLGGMGWAGMDLDVGRAMIAAIVIGIGVDDSIHLLDRYQRNRRKDLPVRPAMREALIHTGRALVTTSFALALGFLALMASAWQTISSFGFFVALAIVVALVATVVLVPAVLFAFSPDE